MRIEKTDFENLLDSVKTSLAARGVSITTPSNYTHLSEITIAGANPTNKSWQNIAASFAYNQFDLKNVVKGSKVLNDFKNLLEQFSDDINNKISCSGCTDVCVSTCSSACG